MNVSGLRPLNFGIIFIIALDTCSEVTGVSEKVVSKLIKWENWGNIIQEGEDLFVFEKKIFISDQRKILMGMYR